MKKNTRREFLVGTTTAAVAASVGCRKRPDAVAKPPKIPQAPPVAGEGSLDLKTTLNGKPSTFKVSGDTTALHVVRENARLTGSKRGCGQGVCGACTMMVDGTPVATCLLPATALEGKQVRTIEAVAGDTLHPVQRAFIGEDALQCGFCTAGFVVESVHFYEDWRKEHGKQKPSHEEVASALGGHICRCGAYAQIYLAVQKACAGDYDDHVPVPPRYDAIEKVTGAAKYTVDIQYPGQLEGRILRSRYGHAIIRKIDIAKAKALPGVKAVHLLVEPGAVARYAGQELAAVAAVDEHTANEALRLLHVDYDVQAAVVYPEAAREPDAPLVYPDRASRKSGVPNANEGPMVPAFWDRNLRGPYGFFSWKRSWARHELEIAQSTDPTRYVELTFKTQAASHTCLEPHSAVAKWDDPEHLVVHLSTQAVRHSAEDLAQRFDLQRENVRVYGHYVGGGFGSKAVIGPETLVAIQLAKIAGAPVRVALDRREDITVGGHRPATEMQVALAQNEQGKLAAMKVRGYANAGVAVGNASTIFFHKMYRGAPKDLVEWDVVTNGPPGKPFRAPGGPPAFFALEQAVDQLAHQVGEDPLTLRTRWERYEDRIALFKWAQGLDVWKNRAAVGADKGRYRRGVGVAAGMWFYFTGPATRIQLDLRPEEGLTASCATQDMGNGTRTSIAHGVAEVFGIGPHEVDVRIGDSDYVDGPMSGGSRTTSSVVPAAQDAARQLRTALLGVAREQGLVNPRFGRGGIDHDAGTMTWSEVFKAAPPMTFVGERPKDRGGFLFPFSIAEVAVGKYLTAGVQVTEVEVDTRLGRIRPLRVWGGYSFGRVIAPVLARSQAQGGILQGLSWALYEERRLDPNHGYMLTGTLDDYKLIGLGDIPEINVHFLHEDFARAEGRGVGMAELVMTPTAASVANAVFHATGWRPTELPIRIDRVLGGVTA